MSEELWLFVDEEVKEVLLSKYKKRIKTIESPSEGSGEYNYTSLFRWADDDYDKRALEHPYEAPWKSGWAVFTINGRKIRVRWNTVKDDLRVVAKIPKIKKSKRKK